jgi:hypothetical protein
MFIDQHMNFELLFHSVYSLNKEFINKYVEPRER